MFKKNTAVTGFAFGLVSASDGSAITTGTVNGYYTLDGGTQASVAGTPVHEGNGQWSVNLTAGEMNGDVVGLLFTHASAINVHFTIRTDTKITSDLNDVSAADVNAQCDTALADYDGPTNAEMEARTLLAANYGTAANQTNIEADTQNIQSRLPAALVGGRMDSDVGAMQPATVTAAAVATDAVDADAIAADGAVEIAAAVWDRVLSAANHNIANSAGRRLRTLQEFQGYENGAVWIDTVNGTAGTVSYENGTVENPVDSIADANTLAAAIGLSRFEVAPGSSITFAATQSNQIFNGQAWTLALGGQDISGSAIIGATVSGIASGTGGTQIFEKCLMGATSHIKGTHLLECGITGTQTLVEAGDFFTDRCHSGVAGTGTPTLDVGAAIGNSNVNFRNYSGGIQLENFGDVGTDTMSLEGRGQLIEGTCTSGTVAIRGNFTVSGITNLTLSDDARLDVAQINAEVDTALSDYDGPTNAEMEARTLLSANYGTAANQTNIETDTQDIQSRLPAALVSGRMSSDAVAISGSTTAADDLETNIGNLDAAISSVPTAAEILAQSLAAESYATDGAVPTLSQVLYMLWSALGDFSISGTTITCKKLDGSTTSMTFTLDDGTNPTSRTRAT